jgi:hypothetical protein
MLMVRCAFAQTSGDESNSKAVCLGSWSVSYSYLEEHPCDQQPNTFIGNFRNVMGPEQIALGKPALKFRTFYSTRPY